MKYVNSKKTLKLIYCINFFYAFNCYFLFLLHILPSTLNIGEGFSGEYLISGVAPNIRF